MTLEVHPRENNIQKFQSSCPPNYLKVRSGYCNAPAVSTLSPYYRSSRAFSMQMRFPGGAWPAVRAMSNLIENSSYCMARYSFSPLFLQLAVLRRAFSYPLIYFYVFCAVLHGSPRPPSRIACVRICLSRRCAERSTFSLVKMHRERPARPLPRCASREEGLSFLFQNDRAARWVFLPIGKAYQMPPKPEWGTWIIPRAYLGLELRYYKKYERSRVEKKTNFLQNVFSLRLFHFWSLISQFSHVSF